MGHHILLVSFWGLPYYCSASRFRYYCSSFLFNYCCSISIGIIYLSCLLYLSFSLLFCIISSLFCIFKCLVWIRVRLLVFLQCLDFRLYQYSCFLGEKWLDLCLYQYPWPLPVQVLDWSYVCISVIIIYMYYSLTSVCLSVRIIQMYYSWTSVCVRITGVPISVCSFYKSIPIFTIRVYLYLSDETCIIYILPLGCIPILNILLSTFVSSI